MANVSGGANPLWMTEWLTEAMDFKPGMRVLDLGCGRAMSSVFLQREFGVEVWATDKFFSVTENWHRTKDAGMDQKIFPIHADARSLPFADEFFDAIVCIDSIIYYGTDDMYLNYLARFVKPGGQIAFAGAGLMQESNEVIPEHLKTWWTPDVWSLHTAGWWRRHWERTGITTIEVADSLPDGWKLWKDWILAIAPENQIEIAALELDHGRYLGYVRMIGRRKEEIQLDEPFSYIPYVYKKTALLPE